MKKKTLAVWTVLLLSSQFIKAQNKPNDILGIWLTPGKDPAKIEIYKINEVFFGKIVWLENPDYNGKPKVDGHNPDQSKRNNPVLGLLLLTGFKFDTGNEWKDGTIYDPESGKTYSCTLKLKNLNDLEIRGYVGIPLFGRTENWKKMEK
jgi:uncharacterized protein (DUF2147 family)